MKWFPSFFKKKNSPVTEKKTSTGFFFPEGTFTTAQPEKLAREGYVLNPSVFSAVNAITKAITQMRMIVTEKSDEDKQPIDNKLSKLLNKPDGNQGQVAWLTEYFGYYLLFGNTFIYKSKFENGLSAGQAFQLKVLSEKQVDVIAKNTMFGLQLKKYEFINDRKFTIDERDILHGKTFNPENQVMGLAPLMAGGLSVDLDNEAKRWNVKLLQNGVNPAGIYEIDGVLENDQYRRLKNQIDENSGSEMAGTEKILEDGMKWKQTGLSPKDADFTKGQAMSKREIAAVYNIAPQLIGDTESQTFANYEQAVLSLHNDTAFPLMEGLVSMLNNWLTPAFGENLLIRIDDSGVEALQRQKQQKWASIDSSNELSQDEKRNAKDFDSLEDEELGKSIIVNGQQTLDNIVNPPAAPTPSSFGNTGHEDEEENTGHLDDEKPMKKPKKKDEKSFKIDIKEYFNIQKKAINQAEDDAITVSHKVINGYFDNQFKEIAQNMKGVATTAGMMPAVLAVIQQTTPELKEVYDEIYKDISFDFSLKARFDAKAQINLIIERKQDIPSEFNILNDFKAEFSSFVDSYFVEIQIGELIKNVNETTIKMVDKVVTAGVKEGKSIFAITKDIQAQYKGDMETWRAERIARTETLRGMSFAQHEAQLKVSPLSKQLWLDSGDSRVRKGSLKNPFNHRNVDIANGKIGLDQSFKVGGQTMRFPRDTSEGASAGNVVNCRCTVVFIDEEFTEFFL